MLCKAAEREVIREDQEETWCLVCAVTAECRMGLGTVCKQHRFGMKSGIPWQRRSLCAGPASGTAQTCVPKEITTASGTPKWICPPKSTPSLQISTLSFEFIFVLPQRPRGMGGVTPGVCCGRTAVGGAGGHCALEITQLLPALSCHIPNR